MYCRGFSIIGRNWGGRPPLVLLLLSLDGREAKAAGETWCTSSRCCVAASLLLNTFLHRLHGISDELIFIGVVVWMTGKRNSVWYFWYTCS